MDTSSHRGICYLIRDHEVSSHKARSGRVPFRGTRTVIDQVSYNSIATKLCIVFLHNKRLLIRSNVAFSAGHGAYARNCHATPNCANAMLQIWCHFIPNRNELLHNNRSLEGRVTTGHEC